MFSAVSLWATPGGPLDPDGSDDPLPEPDPTPIDNLSLILVFAAVSLAVYFLMKRKRTLV